MCTIQRHDGIKKAIKISVTLHSPAHDTEDLGGFKVCRNNIHHVLGSTTTCHIYSTLQLFVSAQSVLDWSEQSHMIVFLSIKVIGCWVKENKKQP